MTAETVELDAIAFRSPPATGAAQTTGVADRRTARLAGLFYLLVGVFGGFAEGYAEPALYATPTAQNLVANGGLARLGVVADLLDQAFFVALAIILYGLLRSVHAGVARAMVVLVIVAAAIAGLNTIFLFEALQVATSTGHLAAFGTGGVDALVQMLLDLQHYGLFAAQVFFGLWLAPLGYLALKSGRFPRALGIVLIVATGCYLADLLAAFLVPDLGRMMHAYVVIPCAVAEIWMVLYLLIIGIRPARP